MSKSVEEQIREVAKYLAKNSVLAYLQSESATRPSTVSDALLSQNDAIDFATHKLLSIIETEVIGEDEDTTSIPFMEHPDHYPEGYEKNSKRFRDYAKTFEDTIVCKTCGWYYDHETTHYCDTVNRFRQAQRNKLRSNPNE